MSFFILKVKNNNNHKKENSISINKEHKLYIPGAFCIYFEYQSTLTSSLAAIQNENCLLENELDR